MSSTQGRSASSATSVGAVLPRGTTVTSGSVVSGTRRFNVEAGGAFKSLDAVRALPLRTNEGPLVRVGDVADVAWGAEEPRSHLYHNGKRAVWITANQKVGTDATKLAKVLMAEIAVQKSYQTTLNNAATLLDLGRICPIGKMWLDAGGRLLQEKETGVTAL